MITNFVWGIFCLSWSQAESYTDHNQKGAYIGMRASVISGKNGVTIGENAVIGACALVNKDIPDNATAVGVPCRILEKSAAEKI